MEAAARPPDGDRGRTRGGPEAWGHPVYVRGDVQLVGAKALLRALTSPPASSSSFAP